MTSSIKKLNHNAITELYLTASGDADEIFHRAAEVVRSCNACVFRQRAFVPRGEAARWFAAHKEMCSSQPKAIASSWLDAGDAEGAGGIQIHAIAGDHQWQPLMLEGETRGWCMEIDDRTWAVTDGLHCAHGDGPAQTRACFEAGESLLKLAGMDLSHLARTWIYMEDILDWYKSFNQVRNDLFIQRGLLNRENRDASKVPASTGMGVRPMLGGRISLEMLAVSDGIKRFAAAGKQRCAYEYGSAFARASEAPTPAGQGLYVSGTAAIDTEGRTCCLNDPAGQIRMTIDNLLAVLSDAAYTPRDIAEAIAYCKTAEIAELFSRNWRSELPWPWVVVVGDVCRSDLLFEAELLAVRQR